MTNISTIEKASRPNTLVVLRSENRKPCAKRVVIRDNAPFLLPYGNELLWALETYEVDSIHDLGAELSRLSKRQDCIVIYGKPTVERERKLYRRKEGAQACFTDTERHWLAIDVDGAPLDDEPLAEQAKWYQQNELPEPLRHASCWYQLTSSQGIKQKELRIRYWFWLDKPAGNEALRTRFRNEKYIDAAIYTAIQPIYICAPRLSEGIDDPLGGQPRTGFIEGKVDAVNTEALGMAEAARMADSIARAGSCVVRKDIEPCQVQIDAAINRILGQSTEGARHHHIIGVAGELYGLGCEPQQIIEVCTQLMNEQGRRPQLQEIENALKFVAGKAAAGKLKTTNTALSSVLDDYEEAPPPAAGDSGEDVAVEAAFYDSGRSDLHNANIFLKKEKLGQAGYIRWQGADWVWRGANWEKLEDAETLPGWIAKSAGSELSTVKVVSACQRLRMQKQKHNLRLPGWISTDRRARGQGISLRNGMIFAVDAFTTPEDALLPHDKDYFNTTVLPFDYDREAACPKWEQCLDEWFLGDEESKIELQKVFGYLLLPDNSQERFFVFTDQSRGRTGKGTVCTVLEWLLGPENIAAETLEGLSQPHALAQLHGKPVCMISEANTQNRRDLPGITIDRLKAITGNDPVSVNEKHKNIVQAKLNTRFVMSCNMVPNLPDPTGALLKRMHTILFKQTFTGREDQTLKAKHGPLFKELPGIFNWAMAGLHRLEFGSEKFVDLKSTEPLRKAFRRQSAPVDTFFDECIEVGADSDRLGVDDIYQVYKAWCRDEGFEYSAGKHGFIKRAQAALAKFGEPYYVPGKRVEGKQVPGARWSPVGVEISGVVNNVLG